MQRANSFEENHMYKVRHSLYLVLASFFWGTTFVAQSVAMDSLPPFTFNVLRFFVGFLVLLPLGLLTGRLDPKAVNYRGSEGSTLAAPKAVRRKLLLSGGALCGLMILMGGGLQQIGLVYTTAGKSGFETALYIILVPIFGLFLKKKCSPLVLVSLALAVVGFYLLCVKEGFSVNIGDAITLCSSACFAGHILLVDHFSPRTNGVQLSCLQFLTAAGLSLIPAIALEGFPLTRAGESLVPILYSGILSSGAGYTLQILGQRGLNPTAASLLMSLESVFSVLAGWLVLGDALSPKEVLGCALVFGGIVLAQLPAPKRRAAKKSTRTT